MQNESPQRSLQTFAPICIKGNGQTVLIQVSEGTIWAQPNGGALRAAAGTAVRWTCREFFSLRFVQLGGTPAPWRVPEATLVDGMYECQTEPPPIPANATAPYYEYNVTVGDLTLDPIIIVDKKPQ